MKSINRRSIFGGAVNNRPCGKIYIFVSVFFCIEETLYRVFKVLKVQSPRQDCTLCSTRRNEKLFTSKEDEYHFSNFNERSDQQPYGVQSAVPGALTVGRVRHVVPRRRPRGMWVRGSSCPL